MTRVSGDLAELDAYFTAWAAAAAQPQPQPCAGSHAGCADHRNPDHAIRAAEASAHPCSRDTPAAAADCTAGARAAERAATAADVDA